MIRAAGLILAAQCLSILPPSYARAQQPSDGSPFRTWARAHGTPLTAEGAGCRDLDPLLRRLANARVIALGEFIHDAHELHLLRNRVARCLTTSGAITAIALESGVADMAPLHEALLQPPPSVASLTRERISYGWGGLPEVQALTEWVRAHNATQPVGRRLRLYGIDVTGVDGSGRLSRGGRSIEELIRYLRRLDVPKAAALSTRLKPYLVRLSETAYGSLSPGGRDSLRALLDSAEAAVQSLPEPSTDKQSQARAWAARCIIAARQVMNYLDLRLRLGKQPSLSPDFPRLVQMRNQTMADNVLWTLGPQPNGGRVLLLAHNAHVFADNGPTTLGSQLRSTVTVGQYLRKAIDSSYVVIGTDARVLGYYLPEQHSPPATHLASLVGTVDQGWRMIDLRAASQDSILATWLRQSREVRIHWGFQSIRPAVAADFLIVADSVSPTGGEIP